MTTSDQERTERTRIRCRTLLIAMLIAAAALTAGTYIHARYDSFNISLTPDGNGGATVAPDNGSRG